MPASNPTDWLPDYFWDEQPQESVASPLRFTKPNPQEPRVNLHRVEDFLYGVQVDMLAAGSTDEWGFWSNGTHHDPTVRMDASAAYAPIPEGVTHVLWFH